MTFVLTSHGKHQSDMIVASALDLKVAESTGGVTMERFHVALILCILIPLQLALAQVDPTAPELKCPYCAEVFPSQGMLEDHILSVHTFVCPYCGALQRSSSALEYHIGTEHTYHCPYCDLVIVGETGYSDHIAALHTYICPVCADTLIGQDAFDQHIEAYHTFECSYCGTIFTTAEERAEHVASSHECSYCDSTFTDSTALSSHIQVAHTYDCPHCGEAVVGLDAFTEHVSYNHTCAYCSNTYPSRALLESHIESDHCFLCPLCEFRAYTTEELDRHISIHHSSATELNESYLSRVGSISLGLRYMQFNDPIEPDESIGKLLLDTQLEYSHIAFGLALNWESPPEESTQPDSEIVFFASSSVRLGVVQSINRYLNVGAGVGYSTTHIFQTEEFAEGTDGHFCQYISMDICIVGGDPTRREIESTTPAPAGPARRADSRSDTQISSGGHGSQSSSRSVTLSDYFSLLGFYIRPSIEHTEDGWYFGISCGMIGQEYTWREH